MTKRKAIWTAVKAVLLVAVLGLLCLVLRRIGFRNILKAIGETDRRAIVAAALLQATVFMLWCFRWLHVMRPEERPGYFATLPIYMAGVFVNSITPGARVGGEPVRAYYMGKAFGGEKTAYLGTIIADKVGYAAVFMGFVIVSVFFVVAFVPIGLVYKLVFGGAVAFVVLAVLSGLLLRHHIGESS
ncbi:MAG: lysylphosphatidylglycerol synthase transmembrane domain-containing protein, partial [Candidatus Brocadiia bacterium]